MSGEYKCFECEADLVTLCIACNPMAIGQGVVIRQMAAEIAPQMDEQINLFMASLDDPAPKVAAVNALSRIMWDNKVGILRILQEVATPHTQDENEMAGSGGLK